MDTSTALTARSLHFAATTASVYAVATRQAAILRTVSNKVHVALNSMLWTGAFLTKNWQWIASAILIPLIAVWWRKRSLKAAARTPVIYQPKVPPPDVTLR